MGDGQQASVELLFERHGKMVFSAAYRVLGSPEDSEDVVQEVFLKLANGQVRQNRAMDWGAFLRVMATRKALDYLRRRSRRTEQNLDSIQEVAAPSNPTGRVEQREKVNALRHALGTLPQREATVFALRYFEELSYEEIAAQLNLSRNQVGVILHRIRKQLREALKLTLVPHGGR